MMNKIKMNFALVAILLGTTFGIATAGTYRVATLWYNCNTQKYETIPSGKTVLCDDSPEHFCLAEGTELEPIPLQDRLGCGALVDTETLK
jgi:hypothetical protein